ncbi:MAG: hypothetical protein U0871_07765 [Gemmataceae bacterium]
MNDLLQATGYAALVYLAFNYLVTFGSGRPLVEWINPGRKYLPLLALALFGGAYTSLRFAAAKHHETQLELLYDLIGKERAKTEVVGAVSFLTFGLAIVMTFLWCWLFLPRAPQTFSPNPKDLLAEYRRALRHYVRWAGGLDFAILCRVTGDELRVVGEGADDKSVRRGLGRLPGLVAMDSHPPPAAVEAQKQVWRELAADLFRKWPDISKLLAPARQGKSVAISFDVRYGALYTEMIEEETDPVTGTPVGVFLFAASLNEHEVATLTAARHFAMLSQAIRHIRTGVAKG